MNIRHILLMTDFSEIARSAYASAVDVASKLDAMIQLTHFAGVVPSLLPQRDRDQHFENLVHALSSEACTHPSFASVDVTPHLIRKRWTRSRQRALEDELESDLVVISPTGRTGIPLALLGSFADRVIRHSSKPVLLFRPRGNATTFDPQSVLVPHDFYDPPTAVLPAMGLLSSHFDSRFRFVHVYQSPTSNDDHVRGWIESISHSRGAGMPTVEDRFAKLAHGPLVGLDVTLETCQGIPALQAVQRANDLPADLVLIGKFDGLGGVARHVVREAPCSVLTVPKS